MMTGPKRYILFVSGALAMMTASGCFLFGGGGEDESQEAALDAAEQLRENRMVAEDALLEADMAIEEERFDAAILEFNRAIRADSSDIGIYFELANLHRELSTQYREDGNLEAAIRENARGLAVLENLMSYQKRNLDTAVTTEMQMDEMPPGDRGEAVQEEMLPDQETAEPDAEGAG